MLVFEPCVPRGGLRGNKTHGPSYRLRHAEISAQILLI